VSRSDTNRGYGKGMINKSLPVDFDVPCAKVNKPLAGSTPKAPKPEAFPRPDHISESFRPQVIRFLRLLDYPSQAEWPSGIERRDRTWQGQLTVPVSPLLDDRGREFEPEQNPYAARVFGCPSLWRLGGCFLYFSFLFPLFYVAASKTKCDVGDRLGILSR
jgi:hypothetical protein